MGVFLSDRLQRGYGQPRTYPRVILEFGHLGREYPDLEPDRDTTADDTFTFNIVDTALDIISNGEWWHGWF